MPESIATASNAPLPSRPLGRSGLVVSVLGFGGAPLGDLYRTLDDSEAVGSVQAAARAGITLFDTAPLYGRGLSEHRIGTALRSRERSSFVLSTKVGRLYAPAPNGVRNRDGYAGGLAFEGRFDYSYDGALRSIEHSLLRLGLDSIDIALIHDIDPWTHGDGAARRQREALDGAYRALDELRAQRLIRALGIGVNDASVCARVAAQADLDCVMLAGRYSLLEQPALDEFLPLAQQRGIAVLLGGVFNSGILATGAVGGAKYNYRDAPPEILERVARIEQVCRAHGTELAHAAIRFPLAHPAVASVVLGAVSRAEVARNIAAFAATIPSALWRDLASERLLRSDAPRPP